MLATKALKDFHIPASLHNPRNNVPIRQSNIPSMTRKKRKPATYRRPPSTFHSEATTHLQIEPLQLRKDTLSAVTSEVLYLSLTRSHKVLKMVPFDIITKVSNIDPGGKSAEHHQGSSPSNKPAVLLGGFAETRQHLLSSLSSLLERPVWNSSGGRHPTTNWASASSIGSMTVLAAATARTWAVRSASGRAR